MPKGPQGQKRPAEVIGAAVMVAKIATGELPESPSINTDKRDAGRDGGTARSRVLTDEAKAASAKRAAAVRWSTAKP